MWATLALAAAMSTVPAQPGQLRLANERLTYGLMGPTRTDSKFAPGDSFFLAFDLENVRVGQDGKVEYSMALEVANAKGERQYRQQPQDLEVYNTLGGTTVPAFARVDVGLDMPPGEYTAKVSVTDRQAKSTQELTRKFQVAPRDFALVRLQTSIGEVPAAPVGVAGQELLINFTLVGFERDKAGKQPNVGVEMRILDEAGKPTVAKPLAGEVKDKVPEKEVTLPMQFLLKLNRPGKFTVQLEATDQVTRKTAKVSFPVLVLESVSKPTRGATP